MARLKTTYKDEIVARLTKEFGYSNVHQVPKLEKISLNMGLGDAVQNPKLIDGAVEQMAAIGGQKPQVTQARKSIANYKLREGMNIGVKLTLRQERMYEFLDRLINIALPRVRDFRGVSPKAFDGRGNYSLGIKEQIIFPEINYDKIDRVLGMNVTIVTSAKTDDEARSLLSEFGMPFRK
ncbi:MAG: 50S ribosomal protein L5 [Myxococcota bacterium]|nr:50S ribosomal protein L5 [Myxococcota bacterium]